LSGLGRRLVDAAMLGAAAAAATAQAQAYQANSAGLALAEALGHAPSDPLSRRFEVTAGQGGAVFGLARAAGGEGAIAASRYASGRGHRPGRKTRHDHACRRRREHATPRLTHAWLHRKPKASFSARGVPATKIEPMLAKGAPRQAARAFADADG
jgi:hypothetical protein